jgi:1,3-beta-glucan synthase
MFTPFCQTGLVDIPPAQRFMRFDRIDWTRAFFKTYYEKWSFGHLLVNFNRICVIHISSFWFYTAYNAPTIYQLKRGHSSALAWPAAALGGAVAIVIMILAMLAEFSYIPMTWNNASRLTRRLLFLLVILGLTGGPTFYIAIVENQAGGGGSLALILGIAQFFISVIATCYLESCPPVGCLATGSQVSRASTSRLKLSRPVIRSYILKRACGECFYGPLYLGASSRNRTFS